MQVLGLELEIQPVEIEFLGGISQYSVKFLFDGFSSVYEMQEYRFRRLKVISV